MRVVYFTCGGPYGLYPLQAVSASHDVLAIVKRGSRGWRRLARSAATMIGKRRRDEVEPWARRHRIPLLGPHSRHDATLRAELGRLNPDLIVIATFDWILPPAILAIPRLGTVNLHPSLLPRHRGANPYFWTYYHDDPWAGVTAHLANERTDGGPILDHEQIALPRGWPVHELYLESARRAAVLLPRVVDGLANGTLSATPQDEGQATPARHPPEGAAMVDFESWDVERVWHFLHGLFPRFREPLVADGHRVDYQRVLGYHVGPTHAEPGTVEPAFGGWTLWCRNGYIHLAAGNERPSALERNRH